LPFFFFFFSKWLIICVFWGFLLAKYLQFKKTARFLYWVVACTSVFVFFFSFHFLTSNLTKKIEKLLEFTLQRNFLIPKFLRKSPEMWQKNVKDA
jgi:hypothetical protein